MFKVGQRVWDIANKEFVIFKQVSKEHSMDTLAVIEREGTLQHYPLRLLHQTADDMFEELGYDKGIDILNYKKFDNKGYGKYISFDSLTEDYICGEVVPKIPRPEIFRISKEEHLAIHQKLIELGWIE